MQPLTVKDIPYLNFGDVRREQRFISLINNITNQPGVSIPKQNKSWCDTKATYAFFKNEQVSLDTLKDTLMLYGAQQVAEASELLIIHDISTISYNDLAAKGLGYLDNKQGRGILCYSSIAVSPEGLPLALLYQHTWTRPLKHLGKSKQRKQTPFEDKESYRWYEAMQQVNELLSEPVHKIHIADRGADIYQLFFHAHEPPSDLLIRARHNRNLSDGSSLWEGMAAGRAQGMVMLEIPDVRGRKKLAVKAEVRYRKVELPRPSGCKDGTETVRLTAIEVKEKNSGKRKNEQPIHWKLLTTLEVKSLEDVLRCVKWYTYRWLIERFHYVLKSGTKIEELQLKQATSLQKAIAVYSLAAFRVMQLVYESRHHPEVSCEVVLTKAQWITLYMLIHNSTQLPTQPPSLLQAVRWIGRLGGHLGRKSDGLPGLKTVWLGYQQLCHATSIYEVINPTNLGKG